MRGRAIAISHDRSFPNRICTHIHAFKGDAHVEWVKGNFEDYWTAPIEWSG